MHPEPVHKSRIRTGSAFFPYGELCRSKEDGYDGTPKLNAINFATGFNSAVYDFSFQWTIDPDMYDNYSAAYIMDEADFFENYKK